MARPLLETKLQVPRRRRDLVARPRLSERLSRGAESELMLVYAPAGFGKTTLLADWLAGPHPVARPRRGFRSTSETTMVEPLSERELDVLRLLGSDLDGPDIARELTVSLNTMRTHTKSIYAKLGVNSRRSAVRRGQELGLTSARRT